MSAIELFSGHLGQRLTWVLAHFVWQGFAVAAVVGALVWLFRRAGAPTRYGLCLVGMLAMAVCPVATFMLQPSSPVVPPPDAQTAHDQPVEPSVVPAAPFENLASAPGSLHTHERPLVPAIQRQYPAGEEDHTPGTPEMAPRATEELTSQWQPERFLAVAQPYMLLLWLLGVMLLGCRLLAGVVGVRLLTRDRRPVGAATRALVARLSARLGLRSVPVTAVSERLREAIVVGLWRPLVLLPAAWLAEMPPEVLEAVIAHELAHIRRWDLWANLVQRLVETFLFYHPAVWWLSHRVGLEREMCADEAAIVATGERLHYVTVLELLGRRRLGLASPQLGAAIGGANMNLLDRVRNILGRAPRDNGWGVWLVGGMALLVPVILWLGSLGSLGEESDGPPVSAPGPSVKPFDEHAVQLIERLQRNPWAGWAADTVVVRRFSDEKMPEGVRSHVQPDITYRVVEKDQLFIRTQLVGGRPTQQNFRVHEQTGLLKPVVAGKGVPAELTLDGARAECVLYESRFDAIGAGFGSSVTTRQWVLARRPSLLIRRESGGNWWAITSVMATKRIGEQEYFCVKTQQRLAVPGGHVVTTSYLHPDVPGHLVEETKEYYTDVGGQRERLWMVGHEQTAAIANAGARPAKQEEQAAWSKTVGGLSGRLVVSNRRITPSEYFHATLQLKNVGTSPVGVQTENPFALRVEVKDAAGSLVKPTWKRADVLTSAQWATVAPGGSVSFQAGFEAKDGGKGSHLDTITDPWKLSPGKYTLLGAYTSKGFMKDLRGQRPHNVWEGEIALPPVEIEVAEAALAPKEVTGTFRLEKEAYCVGEPVFAVFEVVNHRDAPVSFDVGGDYQGSLCHQRFSVRIKNHAGRDFTKSFWNFGGQGTTITLEPRSGKYLEYVLLSPWTHLLPPGDYTAEISRTLSEDSKPQANAPALRDQLQWKVNAYDAERLKSTLAALDREDRPGAIRQGTFFKKNIDWAFADVARKLEIAEPMSAEGFRAKVIQRLPGKWDDRYYLEAHLEENRNWLTASNPEKYTLTFSILNNGNGLLESGVLDSRVFVDGKELKEWNTLLLALLKDKNATRIPAGCTLTFSCDFNAHVKEKRAHEILWRVDDRVSRKVEVRVEDRSGEKGPGGAGNPVAAPPVSPPPTQSAPAGAAQWHRVGKGDLAAVDVERALYEKTGERHFLVRFRVTNLADRPIAADLREYSKVIYPNQWGKSDSDHRLAIDERRMVYQELPEADRTRLLADFGARRLTNIPAGKSIDYYREFNASARADVDRSQGKYLIVSLDGELRLTDGAKVEQFSCDWNHGRTVEQTDLVIPMPVPWKTVPADGYIVRDPHDHSVRTRAKNPATLQARVVIEPKTFRQGDPIRARVLVKNTSDKPVRYDARDVAYAALGGYTLFAVTGPDGKPAAEINEDRQFTIEPRKYVYPAIKPGEEIEADAVRLDTYFYMRLVGKYHISWRGTRVEPADGQAAAFAEGKDWERLLREARAIASPLPPAVEMEIEVLAAPGGGPDGDLVGRVLKVLPPGWKINGAELRADEVRPAGHMPGRGSAMNLVHRPDGSLMNNAGMHLWIMSGRGEQMPGAPKNAAEYLGKGQLGHVYVAPGFGEPLARWNHAPYDLAATLEVREPAPSRPAGPDWGRMFSHILADCKAGAEKLPALAGVCALARLTSGDEARAELHYDLNIVRRDDRERKITAAREDPSRPYYSVSLSIRPRATDIQLDMAEADKSIQWNGKDDLRGYLVRRLGVELVISVLTDDAAFRQAINDILDRQVSRALGHDAGDARSAPSQNVDASQTFEQFNNQYSGLLDSIEHPEKWREAVAQRKEFLSRLKQAAQQDAELAKIASRLIQCAEASVVCDGVNILGANPPFTGQARPFGEELDVVCWVEGDHLRVALGNPTGAAKRVRVGLRQAERNKPPRERPAVAQTEVDVVSKEVVVAHFDGIPTGEVKPWAALLEDGREKLAAELFVQNAAGWVDGPSPCVTGAGTVRFVVPFSDARSVRTAEKYTVYVPQRARARIGAESCPLRPADEAQMIRAEHGYFLKDCAAAFTLDLPETKAYDLIAVPDLCFLTRTKSFNTQLVTRFRDFGPHILQLGTQTPVRRVTVPLPAHKRFDAQPPTADPVKRTEQLLLRTRAELWRIRSHAVEQMVAVGKAAVPVLVEALRIKNDFVYGYREDCAAAVLTRIGDPAVDAVAQLLREPAWPTRVKAAQVLAAIGGRGIDALLRAAADPNPLARIAAAVGLAKVQDPRCTAAIQRLLNDKDPEVREATAAQLPADRIKKPAAPQEAVPKEIAPAEEAPKQPADESARQAQALIEEIRKNFQDVRAGRTKQFGPWRQRGQSLAPLLPHLLASADTDVRREAVVLMRDVCMEECRDQAPRVIGLLDSLLSKPRDDEALTRIFACELLRNWRDVQAVPVLLKALGDPYEYHGLVAAPGGSGEHVYRAVWWEADRALRAITGASPIEEPRHSHPPEPGQREACKSAWEKWWAANREKFPAVRLPAGQTKTPVATQETAPKEITPAAEASTQFPPKAAIPPTEPPTPPGTPDEQRAAGDTPAARPELALEDLIKQSELIVTGTLRESNDSEANKMRAGHITVSRVWLGDPAVRDVHVHFQSPSGRRGAAQRKTGDTGIWLIFRDGALRTVVWPEQLKPLAFEATLKPQLEKFLKSEIERFPKTGWEADSPRLKHLKANYDALTTAAQGSADAADEADRKRLAELAAMRRAAERAEDEHYRALFAHFQAQILGAVKAGNKDELAKLTDDFNQAQRGRLLQMRVTRIDDYVRTGATDAPGKTTILINKPFGDRRIALPNIHYAASTKQHVTRQTEVGRTYILVESNRLEGGRYADNVSITMAIDTRDPGAWPKGPLALRRAIALLELPWQEQLSDQRLDEAAESLKPTADEALDEIMRAFNRSGQAYAYRHRAVQLLQRLGTEKTRATLLDIALGRTAEELPSGRGWAASAYVRTMKDKSDARNLLASADSGVLNTALLAVKGIAVDESLFKRLLELAAWKDKDHVTQRAVRHAAAAVMAADPGGKFVPQSVEAILAAVADVPNMPDASKVAWHSYHTHAEGSYQQYLNCLSEIKSADEALRQATGRATGVARGLLVIARAQRGDATVRPDIHHILVEPQAGLRRAWAARALAAIGTPEDLPLLKKVAESDPLERERGGDVGPPDARQRMFFPVREAARDVVRQIEARPRPAPKADAEEILKLREKWDARAVATPGSDPRPSRLP